MQRRSSRSGPGQLVIGAGATGLVAAAELARRGLRVRVVERRDGPSPLSRAVGILPMSMPLLRRLGVAERIAKEAVVIRRGTIFDGARPVADIAMDLLDGRDMRLFSLPQDRTEAILAERLTEHGVEVEYGRAFEALEQDDGGVDVALADGETGRFRHVLGADGARSDVRAALGIEPEGHALATRWSIADIDVREPTEGVFRVHLLPDGNVIFAIPIGEHRLRVVATVPKALDAVPIDLGVVHVRREGDFAIHVQQVPRYGEGRVWLAGDAAHTHSPVGGRGMNLGMADGADWAARLAEGRLNGYSAARHARGAQIIAFTERVRKLVMRPDSFGRRAALRALSWGSRLPAVRQRINRQVLLPGYDEAVHDEAVHDEAAYDEVVTGTAS